MIEKKDCLRESNILKMHKRSSLLVMIIKVFITHLDQNLIVKVMKIKKQQQNNNMETKSPNAFDYLKSLREDAKDLMDEIEDADDDIDKYRLVFIGSNREKFHFNIFRTPLDFLTYL